MSVRINGTVGGLKVRLGQDVFYTDVGEREAGYPGRVVLGKIAAIDEEAQRVGVVLFDFQKTSDYERTNGMRGDATVRQIGLWAVQITKAEPGSDEARGKVSLNG